MCGTNTGRVCSLSRQTRPGALTPDIPVDFVRELNAVGIGRFGPAAFVFDGIQPSHPADKMKSDSAGNAIDAKRFGLQHRRHRHFDVFVASRSRNMGFSCSDRPLAVKTFSSRTPSRWIKAHCRGL